MTPTAKKLARPLLASFVLVSFILYSFHQREEGSKIVIAPPKPVAAPTQAPVIVNTGEGEGEDGGTVATTPTPAPPKPATTGAYKDGTYTGTAADAYYGFVQVQAVISGGRLTDVPVLQSPHDQSTSVYINSQALPYLKQEAIQAQSSNVNIVSGASDTSQAFIQSLSAALAQAH